MADDPIRAAIQKILDDCGDGWTLADYVVVMGLERIDSDQELESTSWWLAGKGQASWKTAGLIVELDQMWQGAAEPDYG